MSWLRCSVCGARTLGGNTLCSRHRATAPRKRPPRTPEALARIREARRRRSAAAGVPNGWDWL